MRLYFMGICGTAMSNVALLCKSLGHEVIGSDSKFSPPISTLLEESNIQTFVGCNDVDRLIKINPDLVIVGNVIGRENLEIDFLLKERKFPFTSFPEFLNKNILQNHFNVVITGTHGKSTTTELTNFLLRHNGIKTNCLLGGISNNDYSEVSESFNEKLSPFVIEGDEYDTAFFDKRSKFLHYAPNVMVINNLELDHCDIFRDLEDVQKSFYDATKLLPSNGILIYNGDDQNIKKLLPCPWTSTLSVGTSSSNDWIIDNIQSTTNGTNFTIQTKTDQQNIFVPLKGEYNVRNTSIALAAAQFTSSHSIPNFKINTTCLESFLGVKRRQNFIKNLDDLKIINDFAHHPTAVKATLRSIREQFADHYIIACFEPASNTSASNKFQKYYENVFMSADEVLLAPIKQNLFCDKFVPQLEPLDTNLLKNNLQKKGILAESFSKTQELEEYLNLNIRNREKKLAICILSNGNLPYSLKF